MMRRIDRKIANLGFEKECEDEYAVSYVRYNEHFGYTQVVDITRKASNAHLLHSYDKDLFDANGIGNTNVGLTYKELCLFKKKMKQIIHKWNRLKR